MPDNTPQREKKRRDIYTIDDKNGIVVCRKCKRPARWLDKDQVYTCNCGGEKVDNTPQREIDLQSDPRNYCTICLLALTPAASSLPITSPCKQVHPAFIRIDTDSQEITICAYCLKEMLTEASETNKTYHI